MHLCYIDESGTSDIPGNSAYFVLAGISIPIWHWSGCDAEVNQVKVRYGLQDAEIHTAWMLRRYPEQESIPGFEALNYVPRKADRARGRIVGLRHYTPAGCSCKICGGRGRDGASGADDETSQDSAP